MNDPFLPRYFPWLLFIGILLNIPGLWLDIIEPDGALYATIAKHIVLHNDWINLFGDGHDWLDKPHFPFWMAAISYKIFGITGFAYKLPAFIFWLVSLRYTYLLGRDLYNVSIAQVAVLIYAVAFHSTLANFDVRAEPYLTACIVAACWHMLSVYKNKHWIHIIAAALFIACAIMTKGIFVLITIGGGWVIFWLVTRQFRQFLNYRWWVMLGLSFIFILPELYSLYVQFDLHPEKVVFGRTHVSGIRFFFWDSQFGRFFNTGPIKGKGNVSFFLHTTLWAFLPWSVGLVGGVIYLLRFDKDKDPLRWVIYGSALITFLLFSLSKFQLPHYLVIEFPYFSLITAFFFFQLANVSKLNVWVAIQTALLIVSLTLVAGLIYMMGIENGLIAILIAFMIVTASFFIHYQNQLQQILIKGYAMAAILYIFLFIFFYPLLLQYQSGRQAARLIPNQNKVLPVAEYGSFSYSLEFYAPGDVMLIKDGNSFQNFINNAPCYLYTNAFVADSLIRAGVNAEVKATPAHFHVTRLKYAFLNSKTRASVLEPRYLLFIKAN
ncbi:ArnT family glycosyltransferase [Dyadobacter arcticus]|uniref:4-amino-4-deoxy-L-arabinose transferase-like glycosyltransferase n=1 Tax=Dyadobacter arcticus TaxID=1078754 RepID=A0ABX0ULU0_9BACT|nr:glycosyltransferase family 39 protein [Dyadobacter arcticus]NIJ53877.1 4-amino-4-deoxy-L-arabinose transferase-like glycosyltransferase [Dyadobacter arcticus]